MLICATKMKVIDYLWINFFNIPFNVLTNNFLFYLLLAFNQNLPFLFKLLFLPTCPTSFPTTCHPFQSSPLSFLTPVIVSLGMSCHPFYCPSLTKIFFFVFQCPMLSFLSSFITQKKITTPPFPSLSSPNILVVPWSFGILPIVPWHPQAPPLPCHQE